MSLLLGVSLLSLPRSEEEVRIRLLYRSQLVRSLLSQDRMSEYSFLLQDHIPEEEVGCSFPW